MTSPLGKHLSAFVEFPMYETRAWEFTPTGNYDARFNQPTRQLKFGVFVAAAGQCTGARPPQGLHQ